MGDVRRANHALSVIQRLGGGGVRGVARRPFRYRGNVRRTALSEALAFNVLSRVSSRRPPVGRPTGYASLVALVGATRLIKPGTAGNYSTMNIEGVNKADMNNMDHHLSFGPLGERRPPGFLQTSFAGAPPGKKPPSGNRKRGEICAIVVEDISFPATTKGSPIEELSSRAGKVLSCPENLLRDDWKEQLQRTDVKGYTDPALRGRRARLRLCIKMLKSGMITWSSVRHSSVSMFTVVKKILKEKMKDGTEVEKVVQRLIFDDRLINLAFKRPPWISLGGVGAIAQVDVSKEYEEGLTLGYYAGDVPDYYYCLLLPLWLRGFLWWTE